MKSKNLILALIALVAVAAVMIGVMIANKPAPAEPTTAPTTVPGGTTTPTTVPVYDKTITVTVVHGNGTEKVFTYQTNEYFLGAVLYAQGLIEESSSAGMFDTADGEKADWNVDQSYWALYIGADYAMTGVNDTPIHDGDTFKLVYTRG